MARPRKNNITIDEEIIKQEEQVSKSKAKYDADVKKLKDLYAKKDEMKKRELLEAILQDFYAVDRGFSPC